MDTRCKNPRSHTTIGTFMPVYLLEGKKESGAAGRLFCADAGAVRAVGIRPGGGKNRAVSGSVDNAFCHQQSVRFGRGAV